MAAGSRRRTQCRRSLTRTVSPFTAASAPAAVMRRCFRSRDHRKSMYDGRDASWWMRRSPRDGVPVPPGKQLLADLNSQPCPLRKNSCSSIEIVSCTPRRRQYPVAGD